MCAFSKTAVTHARPYIMPGVCAIELSFILLKYLQTNHSVQYDGSARERGTMSLMNLLSPLRAIIALVTYFIVGGIYLYRVKGARGMEVVPNGAFWKDLPFLIKVCM